MKLNEYKFILVTINQSLYKEEEKIIDIFSTIIKAKPIHKDNYYLFELSLNNINDDLHLNDLINVLKDDFDSKIGIFESNVLENKEQEEDLINIYLDNKNNEYMNISSLALKIFDKEFKVINKFRNIVLSSIYLDDDFKKITSAMFKNNLNVSKTANDVYMHRNTVMNKLNMIEKKTGLNIQNFQDAVIIYYLLNLKSN